MNNKREFNLVNQDESKRVSSVQDRDDEQAFKNNDTSQVISNLGIAEEDTHPKKYQKSKSMISKSWKHRVKKTNCCRNFRIVLFDIAYKPKWRKLVVAYKEAQRTKKSSPKSSVCEFRKPVHSTTVKVLRHRKHPNETVTIVSPSLKRTGQSTKFKKFEGVWSESLREIENGSAKTPTKYSRPGEDEYIGFKSEETRDEFRKKEDSSSNARGIEIEANKSCLITAKPIENSKFSFEDEDFEFFGFECKRPLSKIIHRIFGTVPSSVTDEENNKLISPESDGVIGKLVEIEPMVCRIEDQIGRSDFIHENFNIERRKSDCISSCNRNEPNENGYVFRVIPSMESAEHGECLTKSQYVTSGIYAFRDTPCNATVGPTTKNDKYRHISSGKDPAEKVDRSTVETKNTFGKMFMKKSIHFEKPNTSIMRSSLVPSSNERGSTTTDSESYELVNRTTSTTIDDQATKRSITKRCRSLCTFEKEAEREDSIVRHKTALKRCQGNSHDFSGNKRKKKKFDSDPRSSELPVDSDYSVNQIKDHENILNYDELLKNMESYCQDSEKVPCGVIQQKNIGRDSKGSKYLKIGLCEGFNRDFQDNSCDNAVLLSMKSSKIRTEKVEDYFTDSSVHYEDTASVFKSASYRDAFTMPSIQCSSLIPTYVDECIENIPVDCNTINSVSNIRITKVATKANSVVPFKDSESVNEGISHIKITKVVSLKNASFFLRDNVLTSSIIQPRKEELSCIVKKHPVAIDPDEIKENECKSPTVVKNNNKLGEKRNTVIETNPDKLEDIILQIIRDLDPHSLETAINSAGNINDEIVPKKSLRRRRSLKQNSSSKTEHRSSVAYIKEESNTPITDKNSEIITSLENLRNVTQNVPFEFRQELKDPVPPDSSFKRSSENNGSFTSENISQRVCDYDGASVNTDHELPIGRELSTNGTIIHVPRNSRRSSFSSECLRRLPDHFTSASASCGRWLEDIHRRKSPNQNEAILTTDRNLQVYPDQKLLHVHIDHTYTIDSCSNKGFLQSDRSFSKESPENTVDPLMHPSPRPRECHIDPLSLLKSTKSDSQRNLTKSRNFGAHCRNENEGNCYIIRESASGSRNIAPVICWKCGDAFKCERMFGIHFISLHLDRSVLQCLYCPEEFEHEENHAYEEHYIKHLRLLEEDKIKAAVNNYYEGDGVYVKVFLKDGSESFFCLKCNHQSTSCQAIEIHMQEVHHVKKKRSVSCNLCSMQFPSGVAKRYHCLNRHRENMICCEYCYWLYMTKASYYMHLKICPIRRIKENTGLLECQKRYEVDLWWIQNNVTSVSWKFEHDGKKSEKRQNLAKHRLKGLRSNIN